MDLALRARDLLTKAGTEVRKVSQNMMPGTLSKFGLVAALEDFFDETNEMENLQVNYNIKPLKTSLPENKTIMIYRIAQEMTNNTIKHAQATQIDFSLYEEDNKIFIDYTDNGIGFNPEQHSEGKTLGVSGIHSRVQFIEGNVKLKTAPGKGCRYFITIPLHS